MKTQIKSVLCILLLVLILYIIFKFINPIIKEGIRGGARLGGLRGGRAFGPRPGVLGRRYNFFRWAAPASFYPYYGYNNVVYSSNLQEPTYILPYPY